MAKIPNMEFPRTLQPHEHGCIHGKVWKGDLGQAQELSVVSPLTPLRGERSTFKSEIPLSRVYQFRREQEKFRARGKSPLGKRKTQADDLGVYFEQILKYAREATLEAGISGCRLAIEQNGVIFFAPLEARFDDFVWQFAGSNILMIARKEPYSKSGSRMVGRAVNFFETLRRKDGEFQCDCSREQNDGFDTVVLSIDISILQRLTMAPEMRLVADSNTKHAELKLALD
jgi:hypothetical protein